MHKIKAKGILSASNGINIYRGCQHGCIYRDSRSDCYQMKHKFEDIEVKENAPELLEKALASKRKLCMIGTGAMSDPYIPLEKELMLTRKCLEIIEKHCFGATVHTKSASVMRDIDILEKINRKSKAVLQMTLTTADENLCKIIEPNVSSTAERVRTLNEFHNANVPTVVWLSPFLPFINDTQENIDALLDYCIKAGVKGIICFKIGVTLRNGDREYFYSQLDKYFPAMKERYIKTYGNAYDVASKNNDFLMKRIENVCRKEGIMFGIERVFSYLHEYENKYESQNKQLSLFDNI